MVTPARRGVNNVSAHKPRSTHSCSGCGTTSGYTGVVAGGLSCPTAAARREDLHRRFHGRVDGALYVRLHRRARGRLGGCDCAGDANMNALLLTGIIRGPIGSRNSGFPSCRPHSSGDTTCCFMGSVGEGVGESSLSCRCNSSSNSIIDGTEEIPCGPYRRSNGESRSSIYRGSSGGSGSGSGRGSGNGPGDGSGRGRGFRLVCLSAFV